MKTKYLGTRILLGVVILAEIAVATPAAAQLSVHVGIPLPPPIVFAGPPQVVVLPGHDIYVAPDIAEEVYFVDGFWWRPWQGRWYRSHAYDSGWAAYSSVPHFYGNVRQGWRDDYRNRRWEGQAWNYERMPHDRVEQNWSSWKSNNYWSSRQNWGVPGWKGGQRGNDSRHQAAVPQRNLKNVPPDPQRRGSARPQQQFKGSARPQDRAQRSQPARSSSRDEGADRGRDGKGGKSQSGGDRGGGKHGSSGRGGGSSQHGGGDHGGGGGKGK
ncbi:MAG TPA: hypothetical protein VEL28_17170 [Candidatus Binatia bacterium]|nr:hypothetical protein [Candidatus Binatia bacterium]